MNAGFTDHKAINPIFSKQQDSQHFGLFSVYSYQQPFDWEGTQVHMMAGYNQQDSDIDFYDSSGVFLSTGVAYTF